MAASSPPPVGIVVRTRNRPELLARAIRSISAQTFPDWEAVIVNDGGDAAPVDALVAAQTEAVRERIRVVHAETSRGRWVSANAGVLATSAPLLVLHDDDDTWHPEFLERATGYLREHPEAPGALSRIEIVWEQARDGGLVEVGREIFEEQLTVVTLAEELLYNRFVPIGFLYRRSLHEELGLYDEQLPVVGDWSFYLKVLSRGPLEYFDREPYAYWHQRKRADGADANSVIGADDDHVKYDALIRERALREHVDEHGLGLVLYLTKYVDQRLLETEARLTREVRKFNPIERVYRRLRRGK